VNGRLRLLGILAAAGVVFWPAPAAAQVRDANRIKAGTGSISGTVVSADSPDKGLRRVTVMLGAGDQIKLPVNVVTDDAGQFAFTGLGPGTYTLIANRAGFVSSTYGAKTPGRGQGAPISLADGQQITGIVMPMLHGAALSGVVRYPNGRPAIDISVMAMSVKNAGGQRRLNPVLMQGRTDDRGMYRIFGLPPGDYILRVDMSLAGRQEQMRPLTKEEIEWGLKLQAGTSAAGGAVKTPPPAPPAPQPVAYTSIYYPGVADPSVAAIVSLGAAEDRSGIDIACVLVPTATVSGRVFGADGQPVTGLQVRLESAQSGGGGITDLISNLMGRAGARITNDEFSIPNVPPGHYRLIARAKPPVTPGAAAAPARAAANPGFLDIMGAMGGGGKDLTLWAEQQIDVIGVDQSGLSLRLQPGLTVSGRVEFETSRAQPPDPAAVRIGMSPAATDTASSPIEAVGRLMTGTFAAAQKDGTFVVSGLTPDSYRPLFVPPNMMMPPPLMPVMPGGFVLKSAMLNGKDIADDPIEVRQGSEIKDLVVTFTDKLSQISGTLQDASGKPVVGYPIVVFSTNRASWTFGSRRIAQAHPANDGTYKIQGLPAGEYYVCALTDLDPNDLYDPVFLDQLAAASFKISLAEGETKVQDLKLGGG
jgi:hypothetical protein